MLDQALNYSWLPPSFCVVCWAFPPFSLLDHHVSSISFW